MKLFVQLTASIISSVYNIWQIRNAVFKFKHNKFFKNCFQSAYDKKLNSYGSWISVDASFGEIPLFPHDLFGVFISGGSVIGKNCVIFQHVTIGSNTIKGSKSFGAPVIGNSCYIGAGAKIIGNVKIGDNCRIGANCTVYEDMPDNSVAVAAPTRIILKDKLDNRFFTNKNGKWFYYDRGKWKVENNF